MELEQRIERLERENRRLKVAGGAVVAVLLGVALVGAVMPLEIPGASEAEAVRVLDEGGSATAHTVMSSPAAHQARLQLEEIFLGELVIARAIFPATSQGIDLSEHGWWDRRKVSGHVESDGVSIEPGDTVMVTEIQVRDDYLEIHLNGGGTRGHEPAKGSRINLRFDSSIQPSDLTPESLSRYLDPLIDAVPVKRAAAMGAVPEPYRVGAKRGEAQVGMSKSDVLAALGVPLDRRVRVAVDEILEEWQYEAPDLEMILVTFRAGAVVRVDRS